ncbi:hypothetical protein JP74_05995 [Devosia sp. 17-2-E-8]|nr:hypothetical protein JP74_05995 [Devosia sp. 17-2-E-8]
MEDLRDGLGILTDTVQRLPAIVRQAEAALNEWQAEKDQREPWLARGLLLFGFWLVVLTCIIVIWRLAT